MYNRNTKIFCLLLLIPIILSTLRVFEVTGDNWLSGWSYRKYHVINPSAGAGANYQVNVTVHYGSGIDSGSNVYLSGHCNPDFSDVRFTKVDGTTLLDYWIENKFNSANATFWVEIADDLSSVSRTIYLYYGNSVATSMSNGVNTFIFFDDFETNLDKWTLYGKTGLRFSGSNNLGSPLGFGTIADFNGTIPFTLECWFKTSGTGEHPLITRMNLEGNGRGYCLYVINNHIGYELRNTRYDPSNEIMIETNVRTVNDGNWHHVVATYDGSQLASGVHIYLDKVEETFDVQRDTLTDTISCPARFNIATYGGFYWLTGDVDEVVVYTSELTSSDAIARYNNGEGTETILSGDVYAHWTMDEGSGTDVIDVSGHPERNLWLATAGGPVPSWITGVVEAPAISILRAFSGIKSVKIPIYNLASHLQVPYGDKSVHIHFYDEVLPLKEYVVVSIDAGEAEVSYIGLINDIDQYEYRLQDIDYNSGINRTVGWHEFVTRSTTNLKQFIIDGNLMPVTGVDNYCPVTFLITASIAEAPAYLDTMFITKFVNPEPNHGMWSGEDNGHILTTTILSTESDNPSSVTVWTVILVIVDPLTTITQTSITASVTYQTTTTSCTTSKETTKTTTTPSTSTSCTTLKQTTTTTTTASTTTSCTTAKETITPSTTTTPTTSVSTSKTTTSTCTTSSLTSKTTTVATTTSTPTTSVSTSKTTTTTPTTSTLVSRTTSTSFTSTSVITTRSTSTEFSATSTSTLTSKTTTTTPTTTSSTLIVKCTTTTTESTICYTFTRSMTSVTYTSSTTSIRTDVLGLVYGEFTATGTSVISFTAPVYTASPTAWTWTVSIDPFTTYTVSQSAEVPVFVSFLVDRFTLTSATTTEIYNSYTYDAIVTTSTALRSATINFGATTTVYNVFTVCGTFTETNSTTTCICLTSTNEYTTCTSTCSTSVSISCETTNVLETSCETTTNTRTDTPYYLVTLTYTTVAVPPGEGPLKEEIITVTTTIVIMSIETTTTITNTSTYNTTISITATSTLCIVSDSMTYYTTSTYTSFVNTATANATTTTSNIMSTLTMNLTSTVGILGQGWNILMIPIAVFAVIIVLVVVMRRRR